MKSSPYEIACGFAIGAAISFTPFLGLHIIISAIIAYIMRASIISSAIGTIVGNPLTFPFIWALVYNTGVMVGVDVGNGGVEALGSINLLDLLFRNDYSLTPEYIQMWTDLFNVIYVFVIGSIPWVIITWIIFFAIIYPLIKKYKKVKKKN